MPFINIVIHGLDIEDAKYHAVGAYERFTSGSGDKSTKCVNITIIDNIIFDGDKNFTLRFYIEDSDPNVLQGNDKTVVTIIENDGKLSHPQ